MDKTITKKINLGKINYNGTGKRYPAEVTISLTTRGGDPTFIIENGEKKPTGKTTPVYTEFTASGYIWNTRKTDCYCGGQCLDTIAKYVKTEEFKKIYKWWKLYHLNGMHAGTPEQEKAVKDHFQETGERYDYTAAVDYLKSIGLHTVNFTGKTIGREYINESYTYGHGWIINDIPESDLKAIREFIEA